MATLTEAKEDKDIRDKVGTAGLVPLLVQLLDSDEELVVLHVCRTLFHLARSKVRHQHGCTEYIVICSHPCLVSLNPSE
jgi:hypothetical protein